MRCLMVRHVSVLEPSSRHHPKHRRNEARFSIPGRSGNFGKGVMEYRLPGVQEFKQGGISYRDETMDTFYYHWDRVRQRRRDESHSLIAAVRCSGKQWIEMEPEDPLNLGNCF